MQDNFGFPSSDDKTVLYTKAILTIGSYFSDCAVNVHRSCKSLLGECTSTKNKVNTPLERGETMLTHTVTVALIILNGLCTGTLVCFLEEKKNKSPK